MTKDLISAAQAVLDSWGEKNNLSEEIQSLAAAVAEAETLEREVLALRSDLKKARREATVWKNRFDTVTSQRASIHHIEVETRSFSWDAYAMSKSQAWSLLRQAWNKHKKQYDDDTGVPWMTWAEFKENVIRDEVLPIGCAQRDGEVLIGGDK